MKWFKSLSDTLKAAYIGAVALIIAAIISGIFLLVSKPSQPTPTPTPTPYTPAPVPSNTSLPSPQTVLPSPSSQVNTPSAPVLVCPTEEGTGIDLTGQTTTHTFTGTGCENTQSFRVGTNWSLVAISCTGQFEIDVVDESNGTIISGPIDVGVCPGKEVPVGQGGTFSLQINARDDISWTIQICVGNCS